MPTRRSFLKQTSLLTAGVWGTRSVPFVSTRASAQTPTLTAETTYGKLRGFYENGVVAFRGVYYGADTSGKNRFMPPKKPMAWTGIRDAAEYGFIAPQPLPGGNYDYSRAVTGRRLQLAQDEACLTLNVWTPGVGDSAKRAVLVSVHGGGFTGGTSNQMVFDGGNLARMHDLVVVTVNHRLGALGFLDLSAFDPEFTSSGVVGMMDLVAALEWVRDNIGNLGGDPGRVLMIGQSGGGSKVCHLMAMPSAKGLFQRAGVQSGPCIAVGNAGERCEDYRDASGTAWHKQIQIP
jgi:para-nitrobenzyl esterase